MRGRLQKLTGLTSVLLLADQGCSSPRDSQGSILPALQNGHGHHLSPTHFHCASMPALGTEVLLHLCSWESPRSLCGQHTGSWTAVVKRSRIWHISILDIEVWRLGFIHCSITGEMRRKHTGLQEMQMIHQQAWWICFKHSALLFYWGCLGNAPTVHCSCRPPEWYSSLVKYSLAFFTSSP